MKYFLFCWIALGFFGNTTPEFAAKLSQAALTLTQDRVIYDGAYVRIPYPMGDVAKDRGVCTDVVIRAYRKLNIDLQELVHLDMKSNFHLYPKNWGLSRPDTNIDHRRVPNLQVFFSRKGKSLGISQDAADYKTGDIVTWLVNGRLPHIGIVTHKRSADGKRPLIVHNIGGGQVLEDCLFSYKITGRYQFHR